MLKMRLQGPPRTAQNSPEQPRQPRQHRAAQNSPNGPRVTTKPNRGLAFRLHFERVRSTSTRILRRFKSAAPCEPPHRYKAKALARTMRTLGRSLYREKLEFRPDPKFRKMSQIGQGGPPRHPKNQKNNWAQKGPGPKFGPWPLWGPAAVAEGLRIFHVCFA